MKLLTVFAAILTVSFAQNKITEQFEEFFKNGSKTLEPRITGGATAMPNEFPYQVGLLLLSEVNNGFQIKKVYNWCGGSLINSKYVLTAAHCLQPALAGAILLGAHNIQRPELNRKVFSVDRSHFIIHSGYDTTIYNSNDIALIRLPQDVTFSPAIQPIELPPSDLDDSKLVGRLATASGWGRTGDKESTPASLQFVNLKILKGETCEKVYNKFDQLFIKSNVCVDGSEKKSVCPGDSGGPLVINNDDGTSTLIGITSYGHKKGCEQGIPTVFTRVTSYLDWISSNTK